VSCSSSELSYDFVDARRVEPLLRVPFCDLHVFCRRHLMRYLGFSWLGDIEFGRSHCAFYGCDNHYRNLNAQVTILYVSPSEHTRPPEPGPHGKAHSPPCSHTCITLLFSAFFAMHMCHAHVLCAPFCARYLAHFLSTFSACTLLCAHPREHMCAVLKRPVHLLYVGAVVHIVVHILFALLFLPVNSGN